MKAVVLVAALLVALSGCARSGGQSASPGGALVIAQQREPMSLNPALENGASSTELGMLSFQYLVKWNDRGELIGDAATALPTLQNGGISKNGLSITYHLRPGLRFSDGVPLTARDCV
ncbi:MAG: ABC transporter substrate-binding protein, partial [Candidatus Baltobacteraceae bacterium]